MFALSISLNIGIKRRLPATFPLVAALSFIWQTGVKAFAIVVTYYRQWTKKDQLPDCDACLLYMTGTVMLCGKVFFWAYVMGQSMQEYVFDRAQDRRPRSTIY